MTEKYLCIGITGERDWDHPDRVRFILDRFSRELLEFPLSLYVGDCETGADKHARDWWQDKFKPRAISVHSPDHVSRYEDDIGNSMFVFVADWTADGRAAGPIRNRRLAKALAKAPGVKRAAAFWSGKRQGSGTLDALSCFIELGIDVRVIARRR